MKKKSPSVDPDIFHQVRSNSIARELIGLPAWQQNEILDIISEEKPTMAANMIVTLTQGLASLLETRRINHLDVSNSLVQVYQSRDKVDEAIEARAVQLILRSKVLLNAPYERKLRARLRQLLKLEGVREFLNL